VPKNIEEIYTKSANVCLGLYPNGYLCFVPCLHQKNSGNYSSQACELAENVNWVGKWLFLKLVAVNSAGPKHRLKCVQRVGKIPDLN
jgi:hypothetical protein